MPLTPITVRFEPVILEFVGSLASAGGTATAVYIRNAAVARATFELAHRYPERVQEWWDLYQWLDKAPTPTFPPEFRTPYRKE